MNCLIDDTIKSVVKKGKRLEVVRRYIRLKYKINMDVASIQKRINQMTLTGKLGYSR